MFFFLVKFKMNGCFIRSCGEECLHHLLLELLQKLRRFVEKENLDMVVYCNEDDKWSFTITIILLTSSQGVFDMYFK